MPQASNIVLADAQATPVNHTFIPLGPQAIGNWDMVYEDQSRPSPNGYWRIYVRLVRSQEKVAGKNVKITISLQEPVLETIAPAASGLTQPPTVAYNPRFDATYTISDRSVLQDRKDLRKMSASLLSVTDIVGVIENFIPVW